MTEAAEADRERLNLVFIFPDQLRADFLASYGGRGVPTPNMDRLAADGTRYEQAFSASPVCVPARTSLLTGMDAIANGVLDNAHFLRADYASTGIRTWPEILAAEGYYTAAIGKMHFHPWDASLGFQYRVVAEDKRWHLIRDDHDRALRRAGLRKKHASETAGYYDNKGAIVSDVPRSLTADGFVGDEACHFLRTYGDDNPFALMVGFPGPHCPYDPHPDSLTEIDADQLPEPSRSDDVAPALRRTNVERNKASWNGVDYDDFPLEQRRQLRTHYAALVKQVDDEIGRILDTLEQTGLADRTAVILASDHGDYLGDHGMVGKASFFESAIRVPIIARVPGVAPGTTRDELVEIRDITATLLALGGAAIPAWMDSEPLPGLGLGRASGQLGRDAIVGLLADGWMIYDGRWKLHKYATGEVLLFDIDRDPDESTNLAESVNHQAELRRLDAALTKRVMASISASAHDRRLGPIFDDEAFAREGWSRPFPYPLSQECGVGVPLATNDTATKKGEADDC